MRKKNTEMNLEKSARIIRVGTEVAIVKIGGGERWV